MEKLFCLAILVCLVAPFYGAPANEEPVPSSLEEHIVNGIDAKFCEFPHVVFLRIAAKPNDYFCGATLISERYLLTAAHCLEKDISSIEAHFGSTNKLNATIIVGVKKWLIHSEYTKVPGLRNDIAVLTLEKPVPLSKCVQPIEIPNKSDKFFSRCIAVGWGKTGENGHYPTQLQRASMHRMAHGQCRAFSRALPDMHLCMGDLTPKGENICNGDSGTGLMCKRKSDSKYILAGIASFGYNCDQGFGVFVRVRHFVDYIKNNTDL
uniref:S1 type peptidase n=1 Tax=Octopus kaurna TaxID=243731 RepID=B6Z1X6_OCTKA|nr:S1 type peptidase [Octopus kaurna]